MNSAQRVFFLATLDTLEVSFTASVRALRAMIAHSSNESHSAASIVVQNAVQTDRIDEIEEAFAKSIFSLGEDK